MAAAALAAPLHVLDPGSARTLAPDEIRPEEGAAWIVDDAPPFPSDAESVSRLRLLEDGVVLRPHTLHADIRAGEPGRFSHWGSAIRFSTTDGSDPRTNGRRYRLVWPSERLSPVHGLAACAALLVGGAMIALGARGVPRAAGVLVALAAAWLAVDRPSRRWAPAIDAAAARARATTAPTPARQEVVGRRTIRLLGDEAEWEFVARADTDPPPPARVLQLAAEGDEFVTSAPLDLRPADLTALVLRARIEAGEVLEISFASDAGAPPTVFVPVSPADRVQQIRIEEPLLMDSRARWPVRRIELRGDGLRLDLAELSVEGPMARFGDATHGTRSLEIDGGLKRSAWQRVPGLFTLPWSATATRRVAGSVALIAAEDGAESAFEVATSDGRVLHEGRVRAGAGWRSLAVDVPGPVGALHFRVRELPAECAFVWGAWRAVDTTEPPRRVVVVLADTLRADALGCYGNDAVATPTIDALAEDGVRFSRCFSQSYWTRPSVPSLMTGLYVNATGVRSQGQRLPDRYLTFVEAFARAGFHTIGVSANTNAGPSSGVHQGFDELVVEPDREQRTDRLIEARLLPLLSAAPVEDLLVYLHVMEPHAPYGPPDPPARALPPDGEELPWSERLDRPWHERPTAANRVRYYLDDVQRTDAAIGDLLRPVVERWDEARGPGTIVAFLSDHGEFLGEHGEWGHGRVRLFPEVLHVPLVLRAPGTLEPGVVHDGTVEVARVGATLLELAGVDAGVAGPLGSSASLLRALEGAGETGTALASDGEGQDALFAVYGAGGGLSGWNDGLTHTISPDGRSEPAGGPPRTLLDLARSPEPLLRDLWHTFVAEQRAVAARMWAGGAELSRMVDPAELEQLRALGYIGR